MEDGVSVRISSQPVPTLLAMLSSLYDLVETLQYGIDNPSCNSNQ